MFLNGVRSLACDSLVWWGGVADERSFDRSVLNRSNLVRGEGTV
jgi:hypothetical protein